MISISNFLKWGVLAVLLGLYPAIVVTVHAETDKSEADKAHASIAKEDVKKLPSNKKCLKCHDDEDEKVWELDDGREVYIYVEAEKFEESVHGGKCASVATTTLP